MLGTNGNGATASSKPSVKTDRLVREAIAKAKTKKFVLDKRSGVGYADLSVCMQRLVDDMLARVGLLVGTGTDVTRAVNDGITAVVRESATYTEESRQQAADIARTMLGSRQVLQVLRAACSRMQHPATRERQRASDRHLRPVPVRMGN